MNTGNILIGRQPLLRRYSAGLLVFIYFLEIKKPFARDERVARPAALTPSTPSPSMPSSDNLVQGNHQGGTLIDFGTFPSMSQVFSTSLPRVMFL